MNTPRTREEIREMTTQMLPPPEITAHLVRRFTIRSNPDRLDLRFRRETRPVFRIEKKPGGELILSSRGRYLTHNLPEPRNPEPWNPEPWNPEPWNPEPWEAMEIPNPSCGNPQGMTRDLHEMTVRAINEQICRDILKQNHPENLTQQDTHILREELLDLVAGHTARNQRVQTLTQETATALLALINPATYQAVQEIIRPDSTRRDRTRRIISVWRYNTAALLGDRLEQLVRTNPGPTSWVLRTRSHGERIEHPGQIIRLAKQSMLAQGLMNRSWRACTAIPAGIIQAITQQDNCRAATHIMNIIAESGAIPSPEVAEWAANLVGKEQPAPMWNPHSANCSAALSLIFRESQEQPDGQARLIRDCQDILDFVQDADTQGATLTSRTFTGLLRRSSEWHRMIEQQTRERLMSEIRQSNLQWDSLLEVSRIGDLDIIPLTSELDLLQEGSEMRHCSATYGQKCARGDHRMFSIRKGDRRVATMEIILGEDRWGVLQVRGKSNSEPADIIQSAAREIAQAYTKAWKSNTETNNTETNNTETHNTETHPPEGEKRE